MYKLKTKTKTFKIPKKNIIAFAMFEALERHIQSGDICDEETAIKFLNKIGIEVKSE